MFRELVVLWKSWRARFEGGRGGRGAEQWASQGQAGRASDSQRSP